MGLASRDFWKLTRPNVGQTLEQGCKNRVGDKKRYIGIKPRSYGAFASNFRYLSKYMISSSATLRCLNRLIIRSPDDDARMPHAYAGILIPGPSTCSFCSSFDMSQMLCIKSPISSTRNAM